MAGLWDRLTDILGWTPVEDEEQWMEEEEEETGLWGSAPHLRENDPAPRYPRRGRRSDDETRIVSLPGRKSRERDMELAVAEPRGFDEVQEIADRLKKDVGVVVNVEQLDRGEARRVIDFLSGTVYALDGAMQQVSGQVVMFVPQQTRVQMMGEAERSSRKSERVRTPGRRDDEEYNWQ